MNLDRESSTSEANRNPFHPGAGTMPAYLAGRETEKSQFRKLLDQPVVLDNLLLTGLRGVGKTVLLEALRPLAADAGWLWVGSDLSESSSLTEDRLSLRIITDLSIVTSSVVTCVERHQSIGLMPNTSVSERCLGFEELRLIYDQTAGLTSDKLKQVLQVVWSHLPKTGKRGIVFAYDEAQNLADHSKKDEFPMSLLLDVFQSLQRMGAPFILALTGLPPLLAELVKARTFAERMFRSVEVGRLNQAQTEEAISKPTASSRIKFPPPTINRIWELSQGYPYFIQFICRETYDLWLQSLDDGTNPGSIPVSSIIGKLDADFYAGRWASTSDRERELLSVVAELPTSEGEFTLQDIVDHDANHDLDTPFSSSSANQFLKKLARFGLVYKNRHGRYCFAVPLMADFIKRQAFAYSQ